MSWLWNILKRERPIQHHSIIDSDEPETVGNLDENMISDIQGVNLVEDESTTAHSTNSNMLEIKTSQVFFDENENCDQLLFDNDAESGKADNQTDQKSNNCEQQCLPNNDIVAVRENRKQFAASKTDNPLTGSGNRFICPVVFLEGVRSFARSSGFAVSCNAHKFLPTNPHPVHGPDSSIWQRGSIFCNFKHTESNKNLKRVLQIKSTCTWKIKFSFDRSSMDYLVTSFCEEHNHDVLNLLASPSDGEKLNEITLDSFLTNQERNQMYDLAKYNIPLFKVGRKSQSTTLKLNNLHM